MAIIGRQHLAVTIDGGRWDVWTAPIDDDRRAITAAKHRWPAPEVNPVGYLAFLAWHAGRRTGAVATDDQYEAWLSRLESVEVLDAQPVDPTPSTASPDSS